MINTPDVDNGKVSGSNTVVGTFAHVFRVTPDVNAEEVRLTIKKDLYSDAAGNGNVETIISATYVAPNSPPTIDTISDAIQIGNELDLLTIKVNATDLYTKIQSFTTI